MSSGLDMGRHLDLFLQEADEQLEVLERETLELEREPGAERLQAIFRAAHSLKGSSRAMGFTSFAQLTHEMESVLDRLRNGSLAVTTAIADTLLACQDTLRQMADSIRGGKGDGIECGGLVARLAAFASTAEDGGAGPTGASAPLEPPPEVVVQALDGHDGPIWCATFTLAGECVMKFARAFMAFGAIEEQGEVLASHPDREALEEERFDRRFQVFFRDPRSAETLGARFREIGELEAVDVAPWRPPSPTPAPTEHTPPASGPGKAPPRTGEDRPRGEHATAKRTSTGQTVRVDVARLDSLMNLVGELVIDRTRIARIGAGLAAHRQDASVEALNETVGHIARITSELQDQIMKARMMPIETVFNRFPRVVRDLAHKLGKDVRLELVGGDTELDRSVIEVVGDPLLHILRNGVDHGIEAPVERQAAGKPRQGLIVVSARHEENHIVIEISDDGRGIDAGRARDKAVASGLVTPEAAERMSDKEAMRLIFASGLSTATEVSEVSGRGVGLDIVRSNIQRLGGLIDLDSTPGKGSRFSLRLPLTLAIIRGLLVQVAGVVYVLPLGSVVETLRARRDQVQSVNSREVIVVRGQTTPLIRMRSVLGHPPADREADEELYVVVVGQAGKRAGVVVDRLIGEQEVVIKSLSRFVGDVPGVSGATILGDGNVALIADVNGIVTREAA
jgi:two-component system chemotaxis sensor kinase CheA